MKIRDDIFIFVRDPLDRPMVYPSMGQNLKRLLHLAKLGKKSPILVAISFNGKQNLSDAMIKYAFFYCYYHYFYCIRLLELAHIISCSFIKSNL